MGPQCHLLCRNIPGDSKMPVIFLQLHCLMTYFPWTHSVLRFLVHLPSVKAACWEAHKERLHFVNRKHFVSMKPFVILLVYTWMLPWLPWIFLWFPLPVDSLVEGPLPNTVLKKPQNYSPSNIAMPLRLIWSAGLRLPFSMNSLNNLIKYNHLILCSKKLLRSLG